MAHSPVKGTRAGGGSRKSGASQSSSMERVKVHCRLRPFLSSETDGGAEPPTQAGHSGGDPETAETTVPFVCGRRTEKGQDVVSLRNEENFQFDSFLNQDVAQDVVYERVAAPIVASVLEGYNGTIFAYGQTGSGKTYSMFGGGREPQEAGIVPRALGHIFGVVNSDEKYEYAVSLSYVQLYCELLTDLLNPSASSPDDAGRSSTASNSSTVQSLLIREDSRKGVFIEGAQSVAVGSAEEAMGVIQEGDEHRVRATTNMNAASSRSHACIIVNITKRKTTTQVASDGGKSKKTFVKFGKLILVDLAGSERVKKALGDNHNHHGTRFMESKAINLSLSALGNCISALAKKKAHVPYRDAKLTRLLKDSLGGNSMTALVLNIAPHASHYSETKSTLSFGQRAMNVQTRVSINEEIDFQALYSNVQASLDQKDDRIHELEIALSKLRVEVSAAKQSCAKAEQERDMSVMQLKTMEISSEVAEQIALLESRHLESLEAAQQVCDARVEEEKEKAQAAQEEWHRIEYDLKDEREEHLRTCALLREKQEQLADLESSKGERIAELFDDLKAAQDHSEALQGQLETAFLERNGMAHRCKQLEHELQKSKEFQERGLKIMQTLTDRVESLEKRNRDGDRHRAPALSGARRNDSNRRRDPLSRVESSSEEDCEPSNRKQQYHARRKPSLPQAASGALASSRSVSASSSTSSRKRSTAASILRF
ncbi:Kinesin-like protein KIN-UA (Protein ARMADILLO REPEAT KINESIN1) [Durusdinium trenchii]|uniref:Kinesin-like protein n=1 Tax=Durusdinium trenchii TaxID=1381693 RepID=A0ABP0JY25_9DINO